MRARMRNVLAIALAVAGLQATLKADIIFDNTANVEVGGITTTNLPQFATEVTGQPGTSRAITEIAVGLNANGSTVTADLQAFLYANDGAGGEPGTLLWQSAVQSGVTIDSTDFLYAFSVPGVAVPDTFTFAVAMTNTSGLLGYAPAHGPTVGTYVNTYVGSPGTSWQPLPAAFEIEARIVARSIPEPTSLALLGMGLSGFVVIKRSRRRTDSTTR